LAWNYSELHIFSWCPLGYPSRIDKTYDKLGGQAFKDNLAHLGSLKLSGVKQTMPSSQSYVALKLQGQEDHVSNVCNLHIQSPVVISCGMFLADPIWQDGRRSGRSTYEVSIIRRERQRHQAVIEKIASSITSARPARRRRTSTCAESYG
jgi:hypothetical protein